MSRGSNPILATVAQGAIDLLTDRPDLRDLFPVADAIDVSVRAGA